MTEAAWRTERADEMRPLKTVGSGVRVLVGYSASGEALYRWTLTEFESVVADLSARDLGQVPLGMVFGLVGVTPELDELSATRLEEARRLPIGAQEVLTRLACDDWAGSWEELVSAARALA